MKMKHLVIILAAIVLSSCGSYRLNQLRLVKTERASLFSQESHNDFSPIENSIQVDNSIASSELNSTPIQPVSAIDSADALKPSSFREVFTLDIDCMKYEIKKDIISSSFLTAADKKDERPPTVKRKHQVGWATFGIILLINATVYPLLLFGTFLFISAPEIWFVILVAILIAVIVYFTMVGFVRLLLNAYRREGEDDKEHAKANHRKALRLKFRD